MLIININQPILQKKREKEREKEGNDGNRLSSNPYIITPYSMAFRDAPPSTPS